MLALALELQKIILNFAGYNVTKLHGHSVALLQYILCQPMSIKYCSRQDIIAFYEKITIIIVSSNITKPDY